MRAGAAEWMKGKKAAQVELGCGAVLGRGQSRTGRQRGKRRCAWQGKILIIRGGEQGTAQAMSEGRRFVFFLIRAAHGPAAGWEEAGGQGGVGPNRSANSRKRGCKLVQGAGGGEKGSEGRANVWYMPAALHWLAAQGRGAAWLPAASLAGRSEEHTSELQSH